MPLDSYTNGPYLGTTRNPFSYEKVEQVTRDVSTEWLTLDEITLANKVRSRTIPTAVSSQDVSIPSTSGSLIAKVPYA